MKKTLSKTPRKHNRKVYFSIAMREKISANWIKIRKKDKRQKRAKENTFQF